MDKDSFSWLKHISFPTVIERVKTQGVLTPLLWLCGLSCVSAVILGCFGANLAWGFFGLAAVCAVMIFRNFEYFRNTRPELLQTDNFQLAHQKAMLSFQQQSGSPIIDSKPISKSEINIARARGDDNA